MELQTGFVIYLLLLALTAVVFAKRGHRWGVMLIATPITSITLAALGGVVSNGSGSGSVSGWAAFLPPIAALLYSLISPTSKDAVVSDSAGFKKCPFCAEAVRLEAIKCKHCGSTLTTSPA